MVDPKRLSDAVWAGDLSTVDGLIADGADVNVADLPHMPPLHLAIEQMWLEIVRRLIAAGADVNKRREDGWTPLMHAIDIESDSASQLGKAPNTELTKLLLDAGATPTHEAIELAKRYCNRQAESLLSRFGMAKEG
jgi:ankyrin repeat protein